jgi:hypothetical protein
MSNPLDDVLSGFEFIPPPPPPKNEEPIIDSDENVIKFYTNAANFRKQLKANTVIDNKKYYFTGESNIYYLVE